jgi:glucose/arabinose dehydrogenase/mono/diheme cytochrome c family protein
LNETPHFVVSIRMFFKVTGLFLILAFPVYSQQGDAKNDRMDPVVPEKLIPASPVLTVDQALKTFQLAPGFVIEPVAAEPLVEKPVCMDFDPAGRMWVCEMSGFMPDIDGKGESIPQGRIVILEDTDHDGRADKRTVFLEKLMLPRAVAVLPDGVLFIDENRLCWIAREGDIPAGDAMVIDSMLMQGGNVEHKPNGLLPNLDNCYYLAKSDQRLRRVNGNWVLEPTAFRGQWGIARDDFGRLYHNNNSTLLFGDLLVPNLLQGNPGVKMKPKDFTQLGTNRLWPARVTPGVNRGYIAKKNGFESNSLDPKTYKLINATSAAGVALYRGTNFPKEWYGRAFTAEPVGNLVKAIRIAEKEGALTGAHVFEQSEFLASTDERFRPVNAYTAPDGSLYIVDMYHGIMQHSTYMTTYLRKQVLARGLDAPALGHGRIYRVRSKSGQLQPDQDLSLLNGLDLVKMLMHANAWHRETAQRLIVSRKDASTIPFLEKLAAGGTTVARIHAIWTLEGIGALDAMDLVSALKSTDPKLQSSALWATTRLAPEELEKLAPVLISLEPAGKEVIPYLARALGPIGNAKAYDRLAKLMADHPKAPFVREASISGLDQREIDFRDAEKTSLKDADFLKWLEAGSKMTGGSVIADAGLQGDDLASYQRGKLLFHGEAACFGCHGADGGGVPNLGPPLDESEWVTGKPEILANILLHGMSGAVTVGGEVFKPDADMPGLAMNPSMTDERLADISTYMRNEWSNRAGAVSPAAIKHQRDAAKNREGRPWTAEELMK